MKQNWDDTRCNTVNERVRFNVPINTLLVISEISLSDNARTTKRQDTQITQRKKWPELTAQQT